MRWKWIALAAAAALAAWWLLRQRAGAAAAASTSTATPTPAKPIRPPQSDSVDVAYDVDAYAADWAPDDLQGPGQTAFYLQMMRPASRVRLWADIPPEYTQMAIALLGNQLTRSQRLLNLSRRYQRYQEELSEQSVGATIDKVVGTVVQLVASALGGAAAGAAVGYVVSLQVGELNAAMADEQKRAGIAAMLKNASPVVQALLASDRDELSPLWQGNAARGGPSAFDVQYSAQIDVNSEYASVEMVNPNGYTQTWEANVGGGSQTNPRYQFPHRLFTMTPIGYFLPWLSEELTGPTLHVSINKRARIFRLVEFWRTQLNPAEPTDLYDGFRGTRFWYTNPYLGDVKGSYLPPSTEDYHYVDARGIRWNYDGTPYTDGWGSREFFPTFYVSAGSDPQPGVIMGPPA